MMLEVPESVCGFPGWRLTIYMSESQTNRFKFSARPESWSPETTSCRHVCSYCDIAKLARRPAMPGQFTPATRVHLQVIWTAAVVYLMEICCYWIARGSCIQLAKRKLYARCIPWRRARDHRPGGQGLFQLIRRVTCQISTRCSKECDQLSWEFFLKLVSGGQPGVRVSRNS